MMKKKEEEEKQKKKKKKKNSSFKCKWDLHSSGILRSLDWSSSLLTNHTEMFVISPKIA
jgi:hypothetical protein